MDSKKTKLTISGNPKKTFKNFDSTKTQGKKTVVIGKNINKTKNFKSLTSNFKKGGPIKNNLQTKTPPVTSDFERRKLAEQRATKRLKGSTENKEKKTK